MESSSLFRQTIDPHYAQGDVFQRDEAYYTQQLQGTRRLTNNLTGSSRVSQLVRSTQRPLGNSTQNWFG